MRPTLAWFLLELILASTVAHAQGIGSSGNINGTVTDPAGAVLPKATVIVLDTRTGLRRTVATDTTGQFQVTNLFPGTYDLTAEVSGFASEIRRGVVVSVGQTAITDFQIKPHVSTLVEVLDEPPVVVQHSVLFPKVVDQLQLLLVHPAGQCDQQKPERVQGFRHEESNIITALHGGPVGDPLQIYADRFSGHYEV